MGVIIEPAAKMTLSASRVCSSVVSLAGPVVVRCRYVTLVTRVPAASVFKRVTQQLGRTSAPNHRALGRAMVRALALAL